MLRQTHSLHNRHNPTQIEENIQPDQNLNHTPTKNPGKITFSQDDVSNVSNSPPFTSSKDININNSMNFNPSSNSIPSSFSESRNCPPTNPSISSIDSFKTTQASLAFDDTNQTVDIVDLALFSSIFQISPEYFEFRKILHTGRIVASLIVLTALFDFILILQQPLFVFLIFFAIIGYFGAIKLKRFFVQIYFACLIGNFIGQIIYRFQLETDSVFILLTAAVYIIVLSYVWYFLQICPENGQVFYNHLVQQARLRAQNSSQFDEDD